MTDLTKAYLYPQLGVWNFVQSFKQCAQIILLYLTFIFDPSAWVTPLIIAKQMKYKPPNALKNILQHL
jgi:hypothetical protein